MGHARRLKATFIREDLDDRVFTGGQQPGPVGRNLAPKLLPWPLANEGAFGAVALDEPFVFQHVESLANGRSRDAALGGQFIDSRSLLADRPVARFDPTAKQAGKL